jgi:hypothetical protein
VKIVGVADTDSYLKWAGAVLDDVPEPADRRLILLATPMLPSDAQIAAALAGTRNVTPPVFELAALAKSIADENPDVVLLALTGPAVRVVIRAIVAASATRPIFVSGMPGISFPATRRALLYRSQADLLLVHSKRERRDFERVAEYLRIQQRFGLAQLAFLAAGGGRPVGGDTVVFAAQAKVPGAREDRVAVLGWLALAATAHPELEFVVKLRAATGERQTHAERYPFDELAAELGELPGNLSFRTGAMSEYLDHAAALVTVSSTAALEAAARGIPALVLDDFGVSARLINLVFEGSGLLGDSADLIAGRFRVAHESWLDDNYFHSRSEDNWVAAISDLMLVRDRGILTLRPEGRPTAGGALRLAWDRKRVLGPYDRSFSGTLAFAIGVPARWAFCIVRKTRHRLAGLGHPAIETTTAVGPDAPNTVVLESSVGLDSTETESAAAAG